MYKLFHKEITKTSINYKFINRISLFGCNNGEIVKLLRNTLKPQNTEPFKWSLDLDKELFGKNNNVLIIDLKPNSSKPNISLYEIRKIWGYSSFDWTPIMLQLKGLFVDENPVPFNENEFEIPTTKSPDRIFSLMYLNGTVKDGNIEGKWTTPPSSPTNSVLLWPKAFKYFFNETKKYHNN